jgi:hypothetical protein
MTVAWKKILLVLAVSAGVGTAAWALLAEKQGRANLRVCTTVEPGGSRTALIQVLGPPTQREVNPAGTRLLLWFQRPLLMSDSIRAVINVRDDIVMEIDCGHGRIRTYDKY